MNIASHPSPRGIDADSFTDARRAVVRVDYAIAQSVRYCGGTTCIDANATPNTRQYTIAYLQSLCQERTHSLYRGVSADGRTWRVMV